eukprot:1194811-Prorocentrum_minimum.AAC.8
MQARASDDNQLWCAFSPRSARGGVRDAVRAGGSPVSGRTGLSLSASSVYARGSLIAVCRVRVGRYAMNHPAGRIGKRLVFKVKDVMKEGSQICKCSPEENGLAALSTMAANPNSGGCCMVVNTDGILL